MKANKKTLYVCAIGVLICIMLIVANFVLPIDEQSRNLIFAILSSIGTGFFVSLIITTTSYLQERDEFFLELYNNLFRMYLNLHTQSYFTNVALLKIESDFCLEDLDIENLRIGSSLADENMQNIDIYRYHQLSPYVKHNKIKRELDSIYSFFSNIRYIKYCCTNAKSVWSNYLIKRLERENYVLNLRIKGMEYIDTNDFDKTLHNYLVMTTKSVGELYGVTQTAIIEIEHNIIALYKIYPYSIPWENKKESILHECEGIKNFSTSLRKK